MFLFNLDIDECVSDPCQHLGTCYDRIEAYICECIRGFEGVHCEIGKYWAVIHRPLQLFWTPNKLLHRSMLNHRPFGWTVRVVYAIMIVSI